MPALQIACGYLQKPANLNQAELYIAWEAITKVFIYGEGFGSRNELDSFILQGHISKPFLCGGKGAYKCDRVREHDT